MTSQVRKKEEKYICSKQNQITTLRYDKIIIKLQLKNPCLETVRACRRRMS